ncbi:hypothetical protein OUZ56_009888 [Daphnia magna]|uniref:Uncharacterized protein n=1 Tax=Daphnia magna TaxID=35525 RepID=A0ABR0AH56_9CRUS|nr:hypothetical protein OUZ56_009888 [Daphnia magna]
MLSFPEYSIEKEEVNAIKTFWGLDSETLIGSFNDEAEYVDHELTGPENQKIHQPKANWYKDKDKGTQNKSGCGSLANVSLSISVSEAKTQEKRAFEHLEYVRHTTEFGGSKESDIEDKIKNLLKKAPGQISKARPQKKHMAQPDSGDSSSSIISLKVSRKTDWIETSGIMKDQ